MDFKKLNLSGEVSEWMTNAPKHEIETAIELGYKMFTFGRQSLLIEQKQDIAVVQGQKGEAYISELLAKHYPNLYSTAKIAKSGDLSLTIDSNKIIIEVKNYNNTVSSAQIEKFLRDLGCSNSIGGVFISLNSSITGIDSSFMIRYEFVCEKPIPVVYIVSSDEHIIVAAISVINQLSIAKSMIAKEVHSNDKIRVNVEELSESLDVISKTRADISNIASTIIASLNRHHTYLANGENGVRRAIEAIKGEVYIKEITNGDIYPKMSLFLDAEKYSAEIKEIVLKLISKISQLVSKNSEIQWKVQSKKITNIYNNYGFNLSKNKVEFFLPVVSVSNENILIALERFKLKINININLTVDIDLTTCQFIESLI